MTKRVLDIGNCSADHAAIQRLIDNNFDAEVIRAHGLRDAKAALAGGGIDLVLVNRKLDIDGSNGLDIITRIKRDAEFSAVPCMMITNFTDHQDRAVEAGAERGFGKRELEQPETRERLAKFLAG